MQGIILTYCGREKFWWNEGRRTRKYRYNFSEDEAQDIYASACGHLGVMLKTDFILSKVSSFRIKFDSAQSLYQFYK